MHYCYIIKSNKNNKYYIGSSHSITRRLKYHNSGKVTSTKHNQPWMIVHIEAFPTKKEARKRESQIKHWKSRKAIERLLKNNNLGTKSRIHDSRNGNRDENI